MATRRGAACRTAVVAGVLALALAPAGPAAAGGTCHTEATDGSGTLVVMDEICFGPTVLRVAPGTEVTWRNRDLLPHVVAGHGVRWGSQELRRGDTYTMRFDRPGLYPYTCYLHPGMNGVVVVGGAGTRGLPAGQISGDEGSIGHVSTGRGSIARASTGEGTRPAARKSGEPATGAVSMGSAAAGFGAGLLAAVAAATVRRRRTALQA